MMPVKTLPRGEASDRFAGDDDIVEISLLLPKWQIQAMDAVARQRGMNLAQMLRRLIGATFAPQGTAG